MKIEKIDYIIRPLVVLEDSRDRQPKSVGPRCGPNVITKVGLSILFVCVPFQGY